MNPESETLISETAVPPSEPQTSFACRVAKVARLPKLERDKICAWMLDGLSYSDIIERPGSDGKDLKPVHRPPRLLGFLTQAARPKHRLQRIGHNRPRPLAVGDCLFSPAVKPSKTQ